MSNFKIPEFLTSARFWFAIVNGAIVFGGRFGIELSVTELAAINGIMGAIFNVPQRASVYIGRMVYGFQAARTRTKV